ncbi:MAG: hypothetical protein H7067_15785 [Burkholderiales bacterium]|nr:hypothetical protein [Opitutaceae bacterium]
MSPDRLDALRRQRALVAQHLAWLDSEIAAVSPAPASATPPAPLIVAPPTPTLTATPPPEPAPEVLAVANARADEIIAQYSTEDRFDPKSARKGCILLASAVFLLGLAGAMFAYLLYYNE